MNEFGHGTESEKSEADSTWFSEVLKLLFILHFQLRMELEEAEEEEWDTVQYWTEPINANSGGTGKGNCVFNRGLTLGKKILVAGFVASSAPLVLPPLVVASAIGLAVSMPYAFLLGSHACTQSLMSKLLPRPTPHGPHLLEDVFLQPHIDIRDIINKEEPPLKDEAERNNEMVDVHHMKKNEENMAPEEELSHSRDVIHQNGSDSDKGIGNEIEEFKAVTTVVSEECWVDQIKEGDMEEAEMQRETKGLLENIRDEGKTESDSDQNIGPVVVEDIELAQEDKHGSGTEGGIMRNEEDPKVCEEIMLQSRNDDDNKDTHTICNEVEPGEPVTAGFLEGKEVDSSSNDDSQKPMAEPSEVLDGRSFQYETIIPAEPVGDLLIETQVINISVAEEDSTEVINDKTDNTHETFNAEPDGATILQKGKLDDDNISDDFVNQEMLFHEYNRIMDSSSYADAREIADESGHPLCNENRMDPEAYSYTIDLQEESSNVMVDAHTDSMEVLVSSAEPESSLSESSSGKNIICPSQEVLLNEENIWKQIHVIRKIIGYEGTTQASCADELKALYIFTGVEPPTFLKENSSDPAEINEKLHFLMSIVGIKSNEP